MAYGLLGRSDAATPRTMSMPGAAVPALGRQTEEEDVRLFARSTEAFCRRLDQVAEAGTAIRLKSETSRLSLGAMSCLVLGGAIDVDAGYSKVLLSALSTSTSWADVDASNLLKLFRPLVRCKASREIIVPFSRL